MYRRLANAEDRAIRAGALLRLGRALRRVGQIEDSRAAYEDLAATGTARVAGAPAELVARTIAELTGRQDEAVRLREGLLRAKWQLTRGQFEFYWTEAARLSGHPEPPPAEQVALAEAAALAWQERKRDLPAGGEETVWILGMPLFLMWRGASVLVAHPDSLLKPVLMKEELFCAALDSEGRIIAGRKSPGGHVVLRTAAETHLPWTLYITGTPAEDRAGFLTRQRFLVLGITVMVLFFLLGTYFIACAIRRETEVARMQSDFVAAVSHEFRSPLTSMRQLSEMLAFGRISSEERKQTYYETLVRESSRLQRLVEALLNFGKMEAGARVYRFEEVDAASVVHHVSFRVPAPNHVAGTAHRAEGGRIAVRD
jgi:signal transduction histidine kinase